MTVIAPLRAKRMPVFWLIVHEIDSPLPATRRHAALIYFTTCKTTVACDNSPLVDGLPVPAVVGEMIVHARSKFDTVQRMNRITDRAVFQRDDQFHRRDLTCRNNAPIRGKSTCSL